MTASAFDVGSMKCACLLKRSTTAIMASMPVLATGKCVMKSMPVRVRVMAVVDL
jgi:hypothetical protein